MAGYHDLIVWQKSMVLVKEIYRVTRDFPSDEKFGLVSQLRRAAVSVVSNIAEGSCRGRGADFRYFMRVAYSSGAEIETQITVSQRLGFLSAHEAKTVEGILNEVMRMLNALHRLT